MLSLLTKATLDNLERMESFVAAFHAEAGIQTTPTHRTQALRPLLRGSPLGDAFLAGPVKAPIGYVIVSHGYSIEFGGPDAFIDEIYLRPTVRGRGLGGEVIDQVARHLAQIGTKAVHLEVDMGNETARALYTRRGFAQRSQYRLMTRELK